MWKNDNSHKSLSLLGMEHTYTILHIRFRCGYLNGSLTIFKMAQLILHDGVGKIHLSLNVLKSTFNHIGLLNVWKPFSKLWITQTIQYGHSLAFRTVYLGTTPYYPIFNFS